QDPARLDVRRRGLLPHRRPRLARRRGLPPLRRPAEGRHQDGGRERRGERGGGGARAPSRGEGRARGRRRGRGPGRERRGVRRAPRRGRSRGAARLLPLVARELQGAAPRLRGRGRGDPAHRDREGREDGTPARGGGPSPMTAPGVVDVVEYTDPGCSWAWGSEPKLRRLRWRHSARLRWRRVMGGLVGDMANYLDGFDAAAAAPGFARYWERVGATTGMPHPAHLARMYRSTEPACVAVKAAERQGEAAAEHVLRRLREATFLFGAPPDTPERIRAALHGLPVDVARLAADMESDAVREAFAADWRETRAPNAYVRALVEDGEGAGGAKVSEGHTRYVFPTLVFRGAGREATVPGWKPYERYVEAIEDVVP